MTLRALIRDDRGASAAEFTLVLPLLLLMLFGIIDTARFMWAVNRSEKAAQMGVRIEHRARLPGACRHRDENARHEDRMAKGS